MSDRMALQEDLLKLQQWSTAWLLKFNEKKCKVMHIGSRAAHNEHQKYLFNGNTLEETVLEKDLGVYVTPNLKSEAHVAKVAAKANSMVGRIKRTFNYMDEDMFKAVYPSMIRSHMEFAVQAWSPYLAKDIIQLEKVQRRATKLVHNLKSQPYDVRLETLGLTSLEIRRERGDLIQVFKIIHGFDNLHRTDFFELHRDSINRPSTRGHEWKIVVPYARTLQRKKFFDIRIITKWNDLPANVVKFQSIGSFKSNLDSHFKESERGH